MVADTTDGSSSPAAPIDIETPDQLQTILDSHPLVVLDFHAEWCGPCKMMEPALEDLAAETDATVVRIDVDDHQTIAADYQVRGVPTIEAYHEGDPYERLVGATSEEDLRSLVDDRLSS